MKAKIYTLDDLEYRYLEFIQKVDHPKIENLTNWGCHRFFLAETFSIKVCNAMPDCISIEFNSKIYTLDTTIAPDFLDQKNYIDWLQQQLLKV